MNDALEKFGRIVTCRGRDKGLDVLEAILSGVSKAPARAVIANALKGLGPEQYEAIRMAARAAIDSAIHGILFEIFENEDVELVVDGVKLRDVSDGFHGDYPTENGWVGRLSKFPE